MTQIAELAYMAGFLDGEGCISISEHAAYMRLKSGNVPYMGFFGSVKIGQNVTEPLEMFRVHFGGHVRRRSHAGGDRQWDHYEWEAPRSRIVEMLRALLPYLIVKQREATIAIPYFESLARRERLTDTVRAERREMIRLVKEAKSGNRSITAKVA